MTAHDWFDAVRFGLEWVGLGTLLGSEFITRSPFQSFAIGAASSLIVDLVLR